MTRREVREIVVGALLAQVGGEHPVPEETPLLAGGLNLDSIQFLEVVLDIEERTGVVLRGEDLTAEAIATVGSTVDHVFGLLR